MSRVASQSPAELRRSAAIELLGVSDARFRRLKADGVFTLIPVGESGQNYLLRDELELFKSLAGQNEERRIEAVRRLRVKRKRI
jgi:hypothetical protein